MAKPANSPLDIYRGDSVHWEFHLYTDNEATVPYDLAGQTASAEIREKTSAPVLAALDCVIEEPNIVQMDLPAAKSKKLRAGEWQWDLQVSDGTNVRTLLAGKVTVTGDITES